MTKKAKRADATKGRQGARETIGLRAELDINSENPIVVGPEADNPMLKKVAFVIRKKD